MKTRLIIIAFFSITGIIYAKNECDLFKQIDHDGLTIVTYSDNCNIINDYHQLLIDYFNVEKDCHVKYNSTKEIDNPRKNISINAVQYKSATYIKTSLLLGTKLKDEDLRKAAMDPKLLSIEFDKFSYTYWISGNINFSVHSYYEAKEFKKEIINDYLEKYPPTEQFLPGDFDLKKLRRKEMDKFFDIFMEAEKLRAGEKAKEKYVQYIGTMAQCNVEMMTRCYAGIQDSGTYISCPIALELNAEKRMSGFEALKKEAELKGFVLEDAQRILCPAIGLPSVMLPAMKKLGMTDDDLYKLQESGAPKEFLPRIE